MNTESAVTQVLLFYVNTVTEGVPTLSRNLVFTTWVWTWERLRGKRPCSFKEHFLNLWFGHITSSVGLRIINSGHSTGRLLSASIIIQWTEGLNHFLVEGELLGVRGEKKEGVF